MALYLNGEKLLNSLVIDGNYSTYSQETIWTSGNMASPATVGVTYNFSKTLDNFIAIKIVITSPLDGADDIYGEEIWSVASINNAISNSLVINPTPLSTGFFHWKERYFSVTFTNTGFTVTGNGANGESASARPSIFAITGIKGAFVDKIFDTGSVTSLVPVNSQQSLSSSVSNYDMIQVIYSNVLDGANKIIGTYGFDTAVALIQGMLCRAYWYKMRTMIIDFNDNDFTVTYSSSRDEDSRYAISVYQMYGIKF